MPSSLVVITDRGGHLQNAWGLLAQLGRSPDALLVTAGPEVGAARAGRVFTIPYLFSWFGKRRVLNPFRVLAAVVFSFFLALRLRPTVVLSFGAADVVPFCFWARLLGARLFHVECMNQVESPSVTGRILYPLCEALYVQWPELLSSYGPKARYEGWVLGGENR